MRATTNPGGRGHHWVKKMFIDPSPYDRAFDATDIETTEVLRYPAGHSKAGKPLFKRRFIPARLSDNPYLAEAGDYEAMLSLSQSNKEDNFLKVIGILKKVQPSLSLIGCSCC